MKQLKSSPAIQKAFNYVKEKLENGEWLAGECLPSAEKLAAGAQVSIATMIRTIAVLKENGLVTTIERGRIRAKSGETALPIPARPTGAAWHRKRAALEQDILSGFFAENNRLPISKELQTRYGVGYRTMRKILSCMTDDGTLRLRGRSYEITAAQNRLPHQRMVFLTHDFQRMPLTALNRGQYRIFDLLEHECIRREIRLAIMEIDEYNSAGSTRSRSESGALTETGFIVDLWWDTNDMFIDLLENLLLKLSMLKKPVAILDENGDYKLPFHFVSNPLFQVFKIEGEKAGGRVARYLLGMGHRSVAFVSSFHHTFWSKQRFEGVMEEYTKAGCGSGVKKIVREQSGLIREHMLALSGFNEQLIRRLLPRDSTRSKDEIYRRFLMFKKNFSTEQFAPGDIQYIRRQMNVVKELAGRNLSDRDFIQIAETIFWQISDSINPGLQSPIFEEALGNRSTTAWICANDGMALHALAFLRGKKVKVPEEISVVGFDNQPVTALEHRLTSLDFNAHGFIHRILNYIARPTRPRGPYRHAAVEIESVVMQRGTSGQVRHS